MSPRRLPPVPPGALSLGTARAIGLRDHDWRLPELVRITQSVRATRGVDDTLERARAFALALPPDCVFSHLTAARIWGLPVDGPPQGGDVLDVMRASSRSQIERRGCRSHRGLDARQVHIVRGLRVTSLADTWVDLGELAAAPLTVEGLVIVGDAVVARWAGPGVQRCAPEVAAAVAPLGRALSSRVRPRGGRRLTEALALVRPGVRSPMESRARLFFVHHGFPEPDVNAPLFDAAGEWLAEGDLVWRAQRVVGEYQGDGHGGIRARSSDSFRNGLLGDEGWTVVEIYADDLSREHRRRALLRRTARLLGLDPSTVRID